MARENNIQAVTRLVLEKHREYKRKDIGVVRCGVEGALLALGSSNSGGGVCVGGGKKRKSLVQVGGGSNVNSTGEAGGTEAAGSPKRVKKDQGNDNTSTKEGEVKISVNGAGSEQLEQSNNINNNDDDDTLFVIDTEPFTNTTTTNINSAAKPISNTGGMLNAGLRNRYKEQSQRESGAVSDAGNVSNDDNANEQPTSTPASTGTTGMANTPSQTPKKKKKTTKKTPSSKSSSNNNAAEDSFNPNSTSSTLLLPSPRPTERYNNLGGVSSLLTTIRELIEYPLSHPELFLHLGVEPPRGVLLRGPPGCGKTHLAKAIAGELNVSYFQVSAPELVGGVSGESELRVRTLFESAARYAPAIVFIDEIDAIAPKRGEGSGGGGGGKSMEKRIVAQLLTSMDSIHPNNTRNQSAVIVLGATNRPDAMDPALRRAGRFDREIVLGAPDEKAREGILRVMTASMRVAGTLDYKVLAKKTPGFVGADVRSLTKEAAVLAINRIFRTDLLSGCESGDGEKRNEVEGCDITDAESKKKTATDGEGESMEVDNEKAEAEPPKDDGNSNDIRTITPLTDTQLQPLYITMDDFLTAIPHVQPSSKREGFATVPDVSWNDIGALSDIREELTLSVLEPIAHPEKFEALGLPLPAGVLLYGPPGCGKVRRMLHVSTAIDLSFRQS